MSHKKMRDTHTSDLAGIDEEKLADCIVACSDCAQACTACADACLTQEMTSELSRCITESLSCAAACVTTGRTLSSLSSYDSNLTRGMLEVCAAACKACREECEMQADMHEHCRVCAEACQRCEDACNELLASFG